MHHHLMKYMKGIEKINGPVKHIIYRFGVVPNFGDVRLYKGKISWKKPKADYVPTWDANNIADIWIKAGNDSLTLSGILPDDNISIINRTSYEFVYVEDIKDIFLHIILRHEEC